jgi:hypothetical protein
MRLRIILFYLFFILTGGILLFFLNFMVLDRYFVPDPCRYHSGINKPPIFFKLFYTLERGGENGHPFPTTFNFAFTLLSGAFLGFKFAGYIRNKIFKLGAKYQAGRD